MAGKKEGKLSESIYGEIRGEYKQESVKERIKALFFDNVGKVLTRQQIIEVAKDPMTGAAPENWHQRLSELRTDDGYTILSRRDRRSLKVAEYMMPHTERRAGASKRVLPTKEAWRAVLERGSNRCEWNEGGETCGLGEGDIDPVGGGTVKLTPDHKRPHSIDPSSDPDDPEQWQALCGRHQVVKKNYWDNTTGKMNVYAIVQAAPSREKKEVFEFLLAYYGYVLMDDGTIVRKEEIL
jgi:hypothetical protein